MTTGTMSDYLVSLVRTGVAVIVGAACGWGIRHGFGIDPTAATSLITPLAIAGYYAAVRALEVRYPQAGWLLGIATAPTYTPPVTPPPPSKTGALYVGLLDELEVEGSRLGRHILHDARSLAYQAVGDGGVVAADAPIISKLWPFPGRPLDQRATGSCTGNATVHALRVRSGKTVGLTEQAARNVYSRATQIDAVPGQWPPTDTGSDGLSALKAAQELGLYTGAYRWCFGRDDVLRVLGHHGPVIVGIPWYAGFDHPASDGTITISGQVRGGHEVCLHGVDVTTQTVTGVNSWGQWGPIGGHFRMSWRTLDSLLRQQGDAATIV